MDDRVRDAVLGFSVGGGGYGRGVCPVCPERRGTPDRKGSLWHHPETGFYGCWRCGVKGKLEGATGPRRPAAPPPPVPVPNLPAEAVALASQEGRRALSLEPARRYLLERRSLAWEVVEASGAHACLDGWFGGRVLFPCYRGAEVRGFVARAWGKTDRPYLYPKGFDRTAMWNGDALTQDTDRPLLVVEGVFDALRHWPDATAVLGKPSAAQVTALSYARRPLVIALDGDAWKESRALALKLRLRGGDARWLKLPPGEDPDSLGRAWFASRV